MVLTPLYDPRQGQMRIAGFMSGTGSNLRKIIEFEHQLQQERGSSPFHVAVLFSDTYNSYAPTIGRDYNLPVVIHDIRSFCEAHGINRRNLEARLDFDAHTLGILAPFAVRVAAFGGYMSIATEPLTNGLLCINVHPADLRIMEGGKRTYTGDRAVRNAILAGERSLRSTTHIVEDPQDVAIDHGKILMVSPPLPVTLPAVYNPDDKAQVRAVADEHQKQLKAVGDWVIFPRTLMHIAQGDYALDEHGLLHFKGQPIPQGVECHGNS